MKIIKHTRKPIYAILLIINSLSVFSQGLKGKVISEGKDKGTLFKITLPGEKEYI